LSIPLLPFDKSPQLILDAALALREQVAPPMIKHWYADMSAEHMASLRASEEALARVTVLSDRLLADSAGPTPSQEAEVNRLVAQ